MKLSKRGEYALRILIRLSAETAMGRPMVSIGDLARSERIPRSFLEQILLQLNKAGYLGSKRGVAGGYHLARPAAGITAGEVIRLIDGTLAPVSCVSRIAYAPCTCPDESSCGLRILMAEVREAMIEVLDHRTLEEIAARSLAATGRRPRKAGPTRRPARKPSVAAPPARKPSPPAPAVPNRRTR